MPVTSLGPPLASGHTAEIFPWKKGYVLKLFFECYSLAAIEQELKISRTISIINVPVPAVGDIVEIEGRYGLVYERICGSPLIDIISSKPWKISKLSRCFAELHINIHGIKEVQGLPSLHRSLKKKILEADTLPPEEQDLVLKILEKLPEGKQLCHGDFHPGNVMMTAKGPFIIDWADATCGNPLADVARSFLLMAMGHIPCGQAHRRWLILWRKWFQKGYLKRYFSFHKEGVDELFKWLIVHAAARLSEGVPEEKSLLTYVRSELQ